MKNFLRWMSAGFLGIFLCAVTVSGQATGGAVTGSVVDQNGAVVPNAMVRITDKSRGTTFTAQTTGSGSYQFPNVPIGQYTINVEATGFATGNRDFNVVLNQTTTVDVALQIEGAASVVDIIAGNDIVVQSDSSQLGTTFSGRSAQDLPTNGDQNALALLAPNVVAPAGGTAGSGGVSGGVRARGNSFNIDGVDNNDVSVTGPSTGPIQDAVAEFTLLQNNFSAEFGAGAGGLFNTITKSGTNEFHGSVFTYIGSEIFNAPTTDESAQGFKNFFKEVRYGGTFGGPLPYPNFGENDGPIFKSGKNKLFFFAAYEKYYQTGEASSGSYRAPTLAGINQLAAVPGVSPFVIDIFRNLVTLPDAPDPTATATFGNITIGNTTLTGVPIGIVTLPIPASQEQKSYQVNIDHLPTSQDQFRYRFSRTRYLAEETGTGGLFFNNNQTYETDLFSINYIKTFGSKIVNDLRLSMLKTKQDFPLVNASVADFPNILVPSLGFSAGPDGNLPQSGFDNSYQIYDAMTFVIGEHTLKFGADFRRYHGGSDFLPRSRGEYRYSSLALLLQDLRPDVTNVIGVGSGAFYSDNNRFFTFVQDDWRVTKNLTLNLGVRYEYQGLYRDAALQATAAPANLPGVLEFDVPEVDMNNWAPRLGFAWSPDFESGIGHFIFGDRGQSAIRGNFSRSFFSNFSNFALISLPPTLQAELTNTGPLTNFLASGGAGGPFVPNLNPAVLRARAGSYILPQIVPYSDSFAVSYQRDLGRSTGMEIRYLHTRGRDLPVQVQLNSIPVVDEAMVIPTFFGTPTASELSSLPTIGQVVAANPIISPTTFSAPRQLAAQGFLGALTGFPPIGKSTYHGVSASVTRRFTQNVGFTAAYTFSRTRDNSLNELFTSALNPRRAQDAGEYFGEGLDIETEWGPSVVDAPHRFATSFSVDVPFFNNDSNPVLRAILGGFQLNGIFQIQSGQPITVQAGRDANRNGDAAGDRAIVNPDGDPRLTSGIVGLTLVNGVVTQVPVGAAPDPNVRAYLATNPNAGLVSTGFFARELADGGAGTVGRNSFRANSWNRTDLVIIKNTRFGERFNFQIGAEIIDLFNQRPRTLEPFDTTDGAFAIAGNAFFFDYDNLAGFPGRKITMRAKFIF